MEPIKPDEVDDRKDKAIPDEVVEVFNDLIVKNWSTSQMAVIKQEDALLAICEVMGCERHEVFDNRWLEVEHLFRAAGWVVEYDKPAYCETYPATFKFERKGRKG